MCYDWIPTFFFCFFLINCLIYSCTQLYMNLLWIFIIPSDVQYLLMLLLSKCMMYIIMVIIYLLSLNFLSIPLPSWRHPSKAPYVSRGASFIAQLVKNLPAMPETQVQFLDQEDPLEKEMATHSSILAWRMPWAEEPVQSMGSQESDTTESLERCQSGSHPGAPPRGRPISLPW